MRVGILGTILGLAALTATGDEPARPVLHVAYFNPAGRAPATDYRARIDRIVTDIQAFYRDEMQRNGYGPMTFGLERDASGRLVIHFAQSDQGYTRDKGPTAQEVKDCVRRVLAARGVTMARSHVLIFQNLVWEDGDHRITPVAPYSGSGDCISGAALVTDYKLLDPLNFTHRVGFVIDRGNRQSTSRYNMIQIGGVAHELGHSFGLPHNKEQPADKMLLGTALMGAGNYTYRQERAGEGKGSFLTQAHALALATHPLFRGVVADPDAEPHCALPVLEFHGEGNTIVVSGQVSATKQPFGVVLYNDPMPTGVNRDYDALSWGTRTTADGRFALRVGMPAPGEYHMSLWIYLADGTKRPFHFLYRVGGTGMDPVEALQRHVLLIQAEAAFNRYDREELKRTITRLSARRDTVLQRALSFDRRLRRWEKLRNGASVPESEKTVALSSLRWTSARVAWLWPSYDCIELDDHRRKPLESGVRQHNRGLYGHAPSTYRYDIGGKWQTLEGTCGLQKGHEGSVVFVVRGDGRELFRSAPVTDFREYPVAADVSGVRELELIVEDEGDGNTNDWGIWFAPVLKR